MTGARRRSREERRRQIIDVTLDLVAEHGVRGTTLARIASAVGVTTPALYAHFENRKDILLEALEVLFEKRTLPHRQPAQGTAIERLKQIGYRHTDQLASLDDRSVFALFEFIAAPPEEGLRETLGLKHLILVDEIADVVRQGQTEGTIRAEVDPEQTAWMIVGRAWTEDVAHLMGVTNAWTPRRSILMLEMILDSIAVPQQP